MAMVVSPSKSGPFLASVVILKANDLASDSNWDFYAERHPYFEHGVFQPEVRPLRHGGQRKPSNDGFPRSHRPGRRRLSRPRRPGPDARKPPASSSKSR